jgi:hypothetical protein
MAVVFRCRNQTDDIGMLIALLVTRKENAL